MIQLPKPTGPYPTGMRTICLTDESRQEQHGSQRGNREILLNVWYPAQKVDADTVSYTPDFKHLVALNEGIDPQTLAHVETIKTHSYAYEDAKLSDAQETYPGVIFSPGSSSPAATYVTLCEELASHGYMVFGTNHSYMTAHLTFPDGRVIKADPLFTDATRPLEDWVPLLDKEVETWVADIDYVMRWLKDGHKRLDKSKLGIFGHSFGGAAATHCAQRSTDYKAAVNIDGPLFGALKDDAYTCPYMFLSIERGNIQWFIEQVEAVDKLIESARADTYYVQMQHANHNSFREYDILKGVEPKVGEIDPTRSIAITRELLVTFFDKYVKGKPAHALDNIATAYTELIVETKVAS